MAAEWNQWIGAENDKIMIIQQAYLGKKIEYVIR